MNAAIKQPSTHALVKQLKQTEQDFEWYPTTEEILAVIKADIDAMVEDYTIVPNPSILDCGAGDGRSLQYLTKGQKFAIEKAKPLIEVMDKNIYVIGADFHQQTLMDKSMAVTFSNPPYSEYEQWSTKIISETNSAYVYLVIPNRWNNSSAIKQAVELRGAETEVIGSFDFLDSDRAARAQVEIVKVKLCYLSNSEAKTDPFAIWFRQNFKVGENSEFKKDDDNQDEKQTRAEKIKGEIVKGNNIIDVLTELYDKDLAHLIKNYKALEDLDPSILNELDVSYDGLRESFKLKIKGLKNTYWNELFNNLKTITDKLTKRSRENLLGTLTARTDVDFNSDNIYAVVIWVIKNANVYYDDQLVTLVERMVEKANVVLYRSNQNTFGDEQWRFCRKPDALDKFSLDYRVVLERVGGLVVSQWSYDYRHNGLKESAYYFILDILTVATNIGFDTTNKTTPSDFQWRSNKGHDFYYFDHAAKKEAVLMSVKAFKNGNLHVKFAPKFIMKLNVEFGRLKGWVKDAQQAADEMDIDINDAMESFNSNLKLTCNNVAMLEFKHVA